MRVVWVGAHDLSGQGSGGAIYARSIWRLLRAARPDWELESLTPGAGERPVGMLRHRWRQAASLLLSASGGDPARVRFSTYTGLAAAASEAASRCRPDLIILDGPDVATAARPLLATGVPTLLIVHNVEHRLFAESLLNKPRYIRTLMRLVGEPARYERFEKKVWKRASGFVHISASEAAEVSKGRPAAIVPPLFEDDRAFRPTLNVAERPPGPLRIGFLGKLTWWPNRVGLDWFLDAVWPKVRRGKEGPEFHVWGLGSEAYDRRAEGIHGHGFATDLEKVWTESDVMVVPAIVGGGVNVKLCEALFRGKAVIVTRCALRGLALPADPAIVIADSAEEMASALSPTSIAVLAQRSPADGVRALFRPGNVMPAFDACLDALALSSAEH